MAGNHFHTTSPHSGGARSVPLFRAPGSVFGPSSPAALSPAMQASLPFVPSSQRSELFGGDAVPLTPREHAEAMLRVAENAQREAHREYVKARAGIGAANAKDQPASKWHRADLFTPEQVRRRRSLAFSRFNRARAALRTVDRQVAASLADLAALAAA